MKLAQKIFLVNVLFTLLYFLCFYLLERYYNIHPSKGLDEALNQVLSIYFYSLCYLIAVPIWLGASIYAMIKSKKELAKGSIASLIFCSIVIGIAIYNYYA